MAKLGEEKILPKFGGMAQPEYVTELRAKKKSDENEEVTDTIGFKLAMQELTNPPIDQLLGDGKSGGSGTQANIAMLIASGEQTIYMKKMASEIEKMRESNEKTQALQAFQYHGKEVSYDDSVRAVSKNDKEVQFKYDLKFGVAAPADARANCKIEILNDKDEVVFNTTQQSGKGISYYKWDARDTSGKKVEPGDYKIRVTASFPAGSKYGSVEATTLVKGIVESVGIANSKAVLKVNGESIDLDRIVEIGHADTKASAKPSVHETMNYLHKEVEVDTSKVFISDGEAEILYNNTIEKPGKLRIDFFDLNSKYIASVPYDKKIGKGVGSFTLDVKPHNIPDGNYTTKILVEDLDNSKRMVALSDTKVKIHVDAIDVAEGKISSGGKNYDARSVTNLVGESNLYILGSQMVGKTIKFSDDSFNFNGENFSISFETNKAALGRKIGEAELRVFKGETRVATRNVTPVEPESIPTFAQLSADSKTLVNQFIVNQIRLPGVASYANLDTQRKLLANQFIEQEFRAGKLFKDGQDITDENIKKRNMAVAEIVWDGLLNDGRRAELDEEFRYELYTSTTALDDSDVKSVKQLSPDEGLVTKPIIENDELMLEIGDRRIVAFKKLISIG